MRIIGHRGAAGTELENTLASLQAAKDFGVDSVEFDVRKTKDGRLVVCHDADLHRIAGDRRRVSELTLRQLQKIPLYSGSHIPTLDEALDVIGKDHCIIEIKDAGCARELVKVLGRHPHDNFTVASFKLDELAAIKALAPQYKLYGLERTRPFDIIHIAKRLKLDGIGFNYWLLNPLTYWLCRRAGLEIYAYTVDRKLPALLISKLYPDVGICTNYPQHFVKPKTKKASS